MAIKIYLYDTQHINLRGVHHTALALMTVCLLAAALHSLWWLAGAGAFGVTCLAIEGMLMPPEYYEMLARRSEADGWRSWAYSFAKQESLRRESQRASLRAWELHIVPTRPPLMDRLFAAVLAMVDGLTKRDVC